MIVGKELKEKSYPRWFAKVFVKFWILSIGLMYNVSQHPAT